jgi:hypothetical protein
MIIQGITTKKQFDTFYREYRNGIYRLVLGDGHVKFVHCKRGGELCFIINYENYYEFFDEAEHGEDLVKMKT